MNQQSGIQMIGSPDFLYCPFCSYLFLQSPLEVTKQASRINFPPREPDIRLDQLQRRVVKQRKSNHRDLSEKEAIYGVKCRQLAEQKGHSD